MIEAIPCSLVGSMVGVLEGHIDTRNFCNVPNPMSAFWSYLGMKEPLQSCLA